MKKTIAILLAAVLLLACSACAALSPKVALTGEWKLETADIASEASITGTLNATLTVNEDKTFTLSMSMENGESKSVYEIDGTCTEEKNDTVTFNSKHSISKTGGETSDAELKETFVGTLKDGKLTVSRNALPGVIHLSTLKYNPLKHDKASPKQSKHQTGYLAFRFHT